MADHLAGNIRKAAWFLLFWLAALLAYVTYIQVVESAFFASHPLNRRTAEAAKIVRRGDILDRNGVRLAWSERREGHYIRRYRPGRAFGAVVGYDSAVYGRAGLEAFYNGDLAGLNGPLGGLGPPARLWPDGGRQVKTALDAVLQEKAYRALGKHRGAAVVLDPRTGEILAMVSKPGFDPNYMDANGADLVRSADGLLLNRAAQGLYPPGSTIKPLIAAAALMAHKATPAKMFTCGGALKVGAYELPEIGRTAHGKITLAQALAVSCNVAFGDLALKLGGDGVAEAFERFGLGRPAGLDLAEAAVKLPPIRRMSDGDLCQMGVGQGELVTTPLKMALVAAAFANDGVIMRPHLVREITAADGETVRKIAPAKWLRAADPAVAKRVAAMMEGVVEHGTGRAARSRAVAVAGKTGSAEAGGGAHAWFIGFAPASRPRVAVAVIVEDGGSGGGVAAPIAREIIESAL